MRKFILLLLSSLLIISNIAFNTFVLSAEDNQDTTQENQGVEEPADETQEDLNYEVGTLSVSNNEYEVVVIIDESNKIPEGTVLSVQEIKEYSRDYNTYVENAAAKVLQEGDTLPYARFFDISFVSNTGEIIEPEGSVNVQIDLKDDVLSTEDVTFQAVHFIEENNNIETEVLDIETDEVVSFEAESFSTYGVIYYYTVDFYYNDKEYHMNGGSEMMMSDLFNELGIDRSTGDIKSVDFTDTSLVSFTKEGDDYRITSLQPFKTTEELLIVFNDDEEIRIVTKDASYVDGQGLGGGGCLWEYFDDGSLEIRPNGSSGGARHENKGACKIQPRQNDNYSKPETWGYNKYRENITKVTILGNVSFDNNVSASYMFYNMTSLEEIENIKQLDVSNVSKMISMFHNAGSAELEVLDLSSFTNNNKVSEIKDMFNGCKAKKIILNNPNFKTRLQSGSTNGCQSQRMFANCNNLEEVDISNITISGWNDIDEGRYYGFGGSANGNFRGVFRICQILKRLI